MRSLSESSFGRRKITDFNKAVRVGGLVDFLRNRIPVIALAGIVYEAPVSSSVYLNLLIKQI
jgi:hypothetical protein